MKITFNKNISKILASGALALTTTFFSSSCTTFNKNSEMNEDKNYQTLLQMQQMLMSYSNEFGDCSIQENHIHKCFYPEFDENGRLCIKYVNLNHDEIKNVYGNVYNSGIYYVEEKHITDYYNNNGEKIDEKITIVFIEKNYNANEITNEDRKKINEYKNYEVLKNLETHSKNCTLFEVENCNISKPHEHTCFYPSFDSNNNLVFVQVHLNDDTCLDIGKEDRKVYCLGTREKC